MIPWLTQIESDIYSNGTISHGASETKTKLKILSENVKGDVRLVNVKGDVKIGEWRFKIMKVSRKPDEDQQTFGTAY